MRYLVMSICLVIAVALGMAGEAFALERAGQGGEKSVTEHGHHGGWGRRGRRGWHHGDGYYDGGYYHR